MGDIFQAGGECGVDFGTEEGLDVSSVGVGSAWPK